MTEDLEGETGGVEIPAIHDAGTGAHQRRAHREQNAIDLALRVPEPAAVGRVPDRNGDHAALENSCELSESDDPGRGCNSHESIVEDLTLDIGNRGVRINDPVAELVDTAVEEIE